MPERAWEKIVAAREKPVNAFKYQAFISYSHAVDGRLAPAVQSGLHRLARPWYALRALRVFRDKTGLAASSGLRTSLEQALSASAWLLLMASPRAAASAWCREEIEWWLQNRAVSRMLILLSEGEIVWDARANDFDWTRTTALPGSLSGKFSEEPLYVDLRPFQQVEQLSLRHSPFRQAILDIAAPLHGRDKDELDGEDVRQHRRFQLARTSAIVGLSLLFLIALLFAMLAYLQRNRAVQNQIDALVDSSQNALAAHRQLDALVAAVKAGEKIREMTRGWSGLALPFVDAERWIEVRFKAIAGLHRALAEVREKNRLQGHSERVTGLAFGPACAGGQGLIASGSRDGQTILWKSDGARYRTHSHGGIVNAVAISPDCRMIASGGRDRTLQLWRDDGNLVLVLPQADWTNSAAFSPDGRFLASGDESGRLSLYSLDGQRLWSSKVFETAITQLAFSAPCPDGATLLAAASQGQEQPVKIWRVHESSGLLSTPFRQISGHKDRVNGLAINAACTVLATASQDHYLRLSALDGASVQTLEDHHGPVNSVSFSRDGQRLVSGGEIDWRSGAGSDSVRVWDVRGNSIASFEGHAGPVTGVAFGHDANTVISSSADNTVRIWRLDGNPLTESLQPLGDLRSASFGPAGKALLLVHTDDRIRILNVAARQFQSLANPGDSFDLLVLGPIDRLYVLDDRAHRLRSWDNTEVLSLAQHEARIEAVRFSLDGHRLVTADNDRVIRLRTRKGKLLASAPGSGSPGRILDIRPDGRYVVFLAPENAEAATIHLWDPERKKRTPLNGHAQPVNSVRFSPDGKRIVSAGEDKLVKLWNLAGEEIHSLSGHTRGVTEAVFHPNGRIIASSGYDDTIRLWSPQGQELLRIKPDSSNILGVQFTPDGQKLVAVMQNGRVTFWNLDLHELLKFACAWLREYLATNPNLPKTDRLLCRSLP